MGGKLVLYHGRIRPYTCKLKQLVALLYRTRLLGKPQTFPSHSPDISWLATTSHTAAYPKGRSPPAENGCTKHSIRSGVHTVISQCNN